MTLPVVEGTFTTEGSSASLAIKGGFNVSLFGTWAGTVQLKRSFDTPAAWRQVGSDKSANEETPTGNEPEFGVLYKLECTLHTSGTIEYRLGANNV